MDLKDFLREYPQLKLFESTRDNEQVLNLMATSPMRLGAIDLLYDRSPEFQALLKAQGERYLTLLSTSPEGTVTGCFSLSTSIKYIHGVKKVCAYIGDFRTNGSRKVAVLWRTEYQRILKIFQSEELLAKPEYFLTAVLKKNKEAVRNLVGGKKDFGFYYHLLCEKKMVNVIGRWPLSAKSEYEVQTLAEEDHPAIKAFLNNNEKKKQFGSVFDDSYADCWSYRQKNWSDMDLNQFLIIKDQQEKIVACCLLWNPKKLKRMSISRMSGFLKKVIKFFNKLGMNLPTQGQSLDTVYLTHLNIDKSLNTEAVVSSFLNTAFDLFPRAHMISFADEYDVSSRLDDYIKQITEVLLYEVSTNKLPSFKSEDKISFEMSLV